MATIRFDNSYLVETFASNGKEPVNPPWQEVTAFLPRTVSSRLKMLPVEKLGELEEIRLRPGKPLQIVAGGQSYFFQGNSFQGSPFNCESLSASDVTTVLQMISQSSIYALEQEFRNGYLTLPGGHRVGFVGEAVVERGYVKTMKNISSLNIRISREVLGCAENLLPHLFLPGNSEKPLHTLLISPPCGGKTTMLRDLIRSFSSGIRCRGYNVGVVDERSELAGCYHGLPQKDLGPRTDVLDNCPKAEGIPILLRSMSPEIIATDELGRSEDVAAVEEVLNAGVILLATAHGGSITEIMRRPSLRQIISEGVFQRLVVLGRSRGPGTIEEVLELPSQRILLKR